MPYCSPIGNTAERTEKGQQMTRKDYELISEAIRNTRANEIQMGAQGENLRFVEVILSSVAQQLSVLLAGDNSKFDTERFLNACEVKY